MELKFTISLPFLPCLIFLCSPLYGSLMLLGALIQKSFFYKVEGGYDPLTIAFSEFPFCNIAKPSNEVQEDFQLGLISMIFISAALSLVDVFSPVPANIMFYLGIGVSRFGDELKDGFDSYDGTKGACK